MRIGRRQALVGALAIGACASEDVDAVETGPRPPASAAGPPPTLGPSPHGEPPPECEPPSLAPYVRFHSRPAASVFYSWTTAEQVAELRQNRVLFTRTERPGLGPGYAMDLFAKLAEETDAGVSSDQRQIAGVVTGPTFAKARYAWTSAWPTRMGWPGETYGDQLLRIELKPEAYILSFVNREFRAVDHRNNQISLLEVLAAPERIGAIYFVNDRIYRLCGADAGPEVFSDGPRREGSFTPCYTGGGYREYILGNEAMVAEWSHATADTRAEIEQAINRVRSFQKLFTDDEYVANWNGEVVEAWAAELHGCTEREAYLSSLAIPSGSYALSTANVDAIIDTLTKDLFTPDPFVVRPG